MDGKVPLYNIWDRTYTVEVFQPGDFVFLLYLIHSDLCTCKRKHTDDDDDDVADIRTVFISFSTIIMSALLSAILRHNI